MNHPIQNEPQIHQVRELLEDIEALRAQEKKAREQRRAAEEQLAELLDPEQLPEEGQCTLELGKGVRIRATRRVRRKLDEEALEQLCARLDPGQRQRLPVRQRPSLDTSAWRDLCEDDPELARQFEEVLEHRPGRLSLKWKLPT